jgi:hypothetical protein
MISLRKMQEAVPEGLKPRVTLPVGLVSHGLKALLSWLKPGASTVLWTSRS